MKRFASKIKENGNVGEVIFYGSRQSGVRKTGGEPTKDSDWDVAVVRKGRSHLSRPEINQAIREAGLVGEKINVFVVSETLMNKSDQIFNGAINRGERL